MSQYLNIFTTPQNNCSCETQAIKYLFNLYFTLIYLLVTLYIKVAIIRKKVFSFDCCAINSTFMRSLMSPPHTIKMCMFIYNRTLSNDRQITKQFIT